MNQDKKIRLLIVDDSFLIRKILRDLLKDELSIEVVGEAKNGNVAIELIKNLNPDVVTLDYNMPGMNGLEVIKKIKLDIKDKPEIIMVSAITNEGAKITLDCLDEGAVDFVPKPSGETSVDLVKIKVEIVNKIKIAAIARMPRIGIEIIEEERVKQKEELEQVGQLLLSKEVIVIGASTGGPPAIEKILKVIPKNFPLIVIIVQHMPRAFTKGLAERLDKLTNIKVTQACEGEELEKGHCYIAPGDQHLILKKLNNKIFFHLSILPKRNGFRPSIDYTMITASQIFGNKTLGFLLTGMGRDGADGMLAVKLAGGITVAQTPATAVVGSMPQAAIDMNAADIVLDLEKISNIFNK